MFYCFMVAYAVLLTKVPNLYAGNFVLLCLCYYNIFEKEYHKTFYRNFTSFAILVHNIFRIFETVSRI